MALSVRTCKMVAFTSGTHEQPSDSHHGRLVQGWGVQNSNPGTYTTIIERRGFRPARRHPHDVRPVIPVVTNQRIAESTDMVRTVPSYLAATNKATTP